VLEADWEPLLPALLDDGRDTASRAALFHASMAATLVAQASALRQRHGVAQVALSGGVFQNRLLTERVMVDLRARGFRVQLPEHVPVNDAGLSLGQIIEYAAQLSEHPHDD
jgi:hydrogenase maturation protein HypF